MSEKSVLTRLEAPIAIDCKNTKQQRDRIVKHHPRCGLLFDAYNGDYDCRYRTSISCDECMYGSVGGRKDPEAKCNSL